jgi:cell division septal protein FtsQ
VKEYFSRVADVKVSRESLFATSVTVLVEERTSFARWCEANTEALASCYAMDGTGFVFAPIASTSPGFQTPYVFEGALSATSAPVGQQYLPSTFSALLALLERLGQAGYSPEHIVVEGAQDFSIHLARNFALRASFGMDIGSLIRNFELILSSEALRDREGELEYIDLRFGNRVYYKLKGSEQQSVQ